MAIGIGIELGAGGIRAVAIERTAQGLILRAAHDAVCDTANLAAVTSALGQLRARLPRGPAVIGLPGASAILAVVSPLLVHRQRAQSGVQFELQQLLPFELADAVWHYAWITGNGHAAPPAGSLVEQAQAWVARLSAAETAPLPRNATVGGSERPGALVAAMRRSTLEERLGACRQAELPVAAVSLNALAILNAVLARAPQQPGAAAVLLHLINEQTAEWIVWALGSLQVVPVVSAAGGLAADAAAAWEAIRAQLAAPPDTMWVAGDSALVPALEHVLAPAGVAVRRFEPPPLVQPSGARLAQPECWAAALGLALQSVGSARLALNFLAVRQQAELAALVRRSTKLIGGLAAAVALLFGLLGMVEISRRRAQALEALVRREQVYQSLRPELRALLQRQQELDERTGQLEQLAVESSLLTQLLAKIVEALPDAAWLTSVQMSKTATLLEGQVEGRAGTFQDVTRLFERLKTVAGFTTVKPLSTTVLKEGDTELVAFQVQVQRTLRAPAAAAGEAS